MGSEEEMNRALLRLFKCRIPPLTDSSLLHKGQSGRIGVIGGAESYAGAPYYVAMSCLRLGADLSHVFCTPEIAPSIRSFSPDIIVHGTLDWSRNFEDTTDWFERLHVLIIGPGLSRKSEIFEYTIPLIKHAKSLNKLLVFDADALVLLSQNPELLKSYPNAVLTPNIMEMKTLAKTAGIDVSKLDDVSGKIAVSRQVSEFYGGCTILAKGPQDIITDGNFEVIVDSGGSPRRCGGQGDFLSGAVGLFAAWSHINSAIPEDNESKASKLFRESPLVASSVCASMLVRETSKLTFQSHMRSMVASDMLNFIGDAFMNTFETT